MTKRLTLLTTALSLVSGGAHAAQPVAAPPAPAAQATADEQLTALFHASDEANLRRNPINALYRGDLRFADQLGDYMSDAYYAEERAAAEADLKALLAIDRVKLNPVNRIAHDVFRWQTETTLKGLAPALLSLSAVRPLGHFNGFQVFYPDIASGEGAAPFKTLADYENNLKRNRQYVTLIDAAIGRFREGMGSGIVQPRLVVRNMIEQLDTQIGHGVEASTFYGPVRTFPDAIASADQARLKAAYAKQIGDEIIPAYTRLRDFLKSDYLPAAREGVGLVHMPGGDRLYAYLIEQNTTLPMTAEEVHTLGLSEVARIKTEMEAVKAQTGFKGTLNQFFVHLREGAQYKYKTRDEMRDDFLAIGKRVDLRVREQFSVIPSTPLEIRAVPAYREKTDAGGSYIPGTPDGSRPGVFFYNAYDLPSRSKVGSETLYLH